MVSHQIVLHESQKQVATDTHPYRVVCCGRQWGKTTLSVLEMVACAYSKGGSEIAYFATTYDQARNIAWTMLKNVTENILAKTPNESRLEIIIKAKDGDTSRITLRGWENVETTRGQQFDFLVLDEVAQMRNFDYNWNAVLEPTLAFRRGSALFISTPLGFNHFNSMYERGQKDNPYWKSWKFTSYDNPYLPKERIEQAKITSTPEYFAQEYMGDFRKYVGLVYRTFDRDVHTVDGFDIPQGWQIYRTFDFGSTNPTACLWIAVDKDNNWWVVDEYYNSGQTIDYHCGVINANPLSKNVVRSYGDPSGAQWIQEFAQRGIYITPATKEANTSQPNWTRLGIEKIQEKLKVVPGHFVQETNKGDNPSLFVFKRCVNLIKEFETYRWKEKIAGSEEVNEPDMPEKAYDHALDSLRYFAVSYQIAPVQFKTYNEQVEENKWRIGK